MSRFFSEKYEKLIPYTPGEQPSNMKYIKLNTNESPYPVPESVKTAVCRAAEDVRLYSDPECLRLREKMAERFCVDSENIIMTNGSDEVLNLAFAAFCDDETPAVFADITYGFYPVFAEQNRIPYTEIPLKDDFSIDVRDYMGIGKTIVIANPNAPTGMALSLSEIEKIVASNPENVVIIDEAYVDFGGESAIGLTKKYDNLLVCGTFSKSRSMAGARLGFGIGNAELIRDLDTLRYSVNPYNVNSMTAAAGIAALDENEYFSDCCERIKSTREKTREALATLGFEVLPSSANFLFVRCEGLSGEEIYRGLRSRGILVRHFTLPRIADYNRITIGTEREMEILINEIRNITEGEK